MNKIANLLNYRGYMVGEIWEGNNTFHLKLSEKGKSYIDGLDLSIIRFRNLTDLQRYGKYILGQDVKIDWMLK